jgi:hypothetical protein
MAQKPTSELVGREVVGFRDDKIGKIDELCFHGDGQEPTWALVKMGVLGTSSVLIPLHDAEVEDDCVRIFYEKEHVKAAPSVEPEGDRISDDGAVLLHRHFGLEPLAAAARDDDEDDAELPREPREANPPGMEEGPDNPITQRRRERARELGVTEDS